MKTYYTDTEWSKLSDAQQRRIIQASDEIIDECKYCGDTHTMRHSRCKTMCEDCGRFYEKYKSYRAKQRHEPTEAKQKTLNQMKAVYREKALMGYKVPKSIFERY